MKKNLFMLFTLIGIIALAGCKGSENVTVEERPTTKSKKVKLDPYYREFDEKLAVGDPVNFYNEFPIYIDTEVPIKVKIFENGKGMEVDSSIVFKLDVPAETVGNLLYIETEKTKSGVKAKKITVQFDLNDSNYDFVFEAETSTVDKRTYFYLASKKNVLIEGKPYEVPVSTKPDNGTGDCRLFADLDQIDRKRTIEGTAGGVPIIEGTKVIK